MFLKAVPQSTGMILTPSVALRMAAASSVAGDVLAAQVLLQQRVVDVGDRLDQALPRRSATSAAMSSGIGSSWNFAPRVSSSQTIGLHPRPGR